MTRFFRRAISPASFRHAHCSITFTPGGGGGVLGNRLATARVFAGVRKLESSGSPPFASGAKRSPAPAASGADVSRGASAAAASAGPSAAAVPPPPPPAALSSFASARSALGGVFSSLDFSFSFSFSAAASAASRPRVGRLSSAFAPAASSPASAASVASPPPPRGFDPRSPPFAAEGCCSSDADSPPFTAAPAPPLVVASSAAVPEEPPGPTPASG